MGNDEIKKYLQIHDELKSLISQLTKEEFEQLEQNIITNGCRDALVVWKDGQNYILLDGHNRHEICTKHKITFQIILEKDITSLDQAKEWMILNQLGRRK